MTAALLIATGLVLQLSFVAAAKGADMPAYGDFKEALKQLQVRRKPGSMKSIEQSSPSRWLRLRAGAILADYYAALGQWTSFADFAKSASGCAQLRYELHRGPRAAAAAALSAALQDRLATKLCQLALSEAAAAGVLDDRLIWQRVRALIDASKTRHARFLLPLLRDSKVSFSKLNVAVQQATKRIKGKHSLKSRAARELLAVSAVVVAKREPALVAQRWAAFDSYLSPAINDQVWAVIGHWAARYHLRQALSWYRKVPLSAHNSEQLAWRVRAALRAGNWQQVQSTIEAMTAADRNLSTWQYWRARALHQLGSSGAARIALQLLAASDDEYYGLIASEELGLRLDPGNDQPQPELVKRMGADPDVRLALAFVAAKRESQARQVWKFLRRQLAAPEMFAAAQVAADHGWLLGSINAAAEVVPEANSLALRYPTPHHELIAKQAAKHGLRVALIYAMIRQESSFNAKAVSRAGARGIMQIMPATARQVARRNKYNAYRLSRLTRVDTNVTIGTTYLAELERMFDHDAVLIAGAYNAGPHRVKRWIKRSRVDKMIYVETIPFTETRLYVKAVLGALVQYGRILDGRVLSLRSLLGGTYS